MERSPVRSRSAPRRHLLPRLGPERPARRVQAGSVRYVHGSDARSADDVRGAMAEAADRDRAPARARSVAATAEPWGDRTGGRPAGRPTPSDAYGGIQTRR